MLHADVQPAHMTKATYNFATFRRELVKSELEPCNRLTVVACLSRLQASGVNTGHNTGPCDVKSRRRTRRGQLHDLGILCHIPSPLLEMLIPAGKAAPELTDDNPARVGWGLRDTKPGQGAWLYDSPCELNWQRRRSLYKPPYCHDLGV